MNPLKLQMHLNRKQQTPVMRCQPLIPNSNININTKSIYASKTPKTPNVDIVESIGSLFGGKSAPAASETAKLNNAEAQKDNTEVTAIAEAEPKSEPAQAEKPRAGFKKGDVEISEAIPVPLTDPEDIEVVQSEAPEPRSTSQDKPVETSPASKALPNVADTSAKPIVVTPEVVADDATAALNNRAATVATPAPRRIASSGSRMLQMSIFERENQAFHCLTQLQQKVPASALLRARIIKSTTGQAVLRVGPVNDPELETAICDTAQDCGKEIQCRMISENGITSAAAAATQSAQDSNAPMPRNLTNYDAASAPVVATLDGQGVWVQLGTSSTESEAQDRYETLAKENADVLKDFKPVINTPEYQSLAGKVYRIRIGPFKERKQAQNICGTLSSRGVGCLVLSK